MNFQRARYKRECLELTAKELGWESWHERKKAEGERSCLPAEKAVDVTMNFMWKKLGCNNE